MQFDWYTLTHLLRSKQQHAHKKHEGESPWDVLIQITLPMILILALVVITQINVYKKAYENLKNAIKNTSTGDTIKDYEKALLKLQLQYLIVALEKVKQEEEKAFLLNRFSDRSVFIHSGEINDPFFNKLCEKTYNVFNEISDMREKENGLYRKVLRESKLTENRMMWARERDGVIDSSALENGYITLANSNYVKNKIQGFLNGFKRRTKKLQFGVIFEILRDIIANPPSDLEPEAQRLIAEIRTISQRGGDPSPYLNEFMEFQIENIKLRLRTQEYVFLEATWQDIRI